MITNLETNYRDITSAIYSTTASLTYIVTACLVRYLRNFSIFQLMSIRQIVVFSLNTMALNVDDKVYQLNLLPRIILRSVCFLIASLSYFVACQIGPIWKVQLILQTSPIWIALISVFILKTSQYSHKLFLVILVSFIGILLIVRPPFIRQIEQLFSNFEQTDYKEDSILTTIFGIIAALGNTLATLAIGPLKNKTTNKVLVQIPAFLGIIVYSVIQIILEVKAKSIDYFSMILMILTGIVTFISQSLIHRALMIGDITYVSIIGYSGVVYAFLADSIFFNATFNITNGIGGALVTMSLIYIVRQKK